MGLDSTSAGSTGTKATFVSGNESNRLGTIPIFIIRILERINPRAWRALSGQEGAPRSGPWRAPVGGHVRSSALLRRGGDSWCTIMLQKGMARMGEWGNPCTWPQPVEWCTIDIYNYSISCTLLNLQLQYFIALFWSIRLTDNVQHCTHINNREFLVSCIVVRVDD